MRVMAAPSLSAKGSEKEWAQAQAAKHVHPAPEAASELYVTLLLPSARSPSQMCCLKLAQDQIVNSTLGTPRDTPLLATGTGLLAPAAFFLDARS
eukprot:6491697-Amphidinium_carterae.1